VTSYSTQYVTFRQRLRAGLGMHDTKN